jgi:hypothetical protein
MFFFSRPVFIASIQKLEKSVSTSFEYSWLCVLMSGLDALEGDQWDNRVSTPQMVVDWFMWEPRTLLSFLTKYTIVAMLLLVHIVLAGCGIALKVCFWIAMWPICVFALYIHAWKRISVRDTTVEIN